MCPVDGEPLVADDRSAPTSHGFRGGARAATPASAAAAQQLGPAADVAPILVDDTLAPGSLVGEYEVTEKIGEGGMGVVYAGVHPLIGKKVAIKLLNLALSQDPVMVQRFVQEARAVNQIGHHNIVDIFAFGQLPNGRHYFVMEYLQGQSLKRRLHKDPPLTYAEAFAILIAVCDALAAAHATGIIHRDLKPDNIYLVDRGVKLLDFGIAKLLRRGEDLGHTRTGAPIGTPYYMSPEQCRQRGVDARSDLYAMGVIMFDLFSGKLPFAGPDYIDIVNAHLGQPPPLPTDFQAGIPVELEALILHCLEKDPDARPQSAAEVAEKLAAIAAAAPADALLPERTSATADTAAGSARSATKGTHRPTGSKRSRRVGRLSLWRRQIILGSLLVAGVAGVAGGLWLGRREPQASPAPLQLDVESQPAGAQILVDGRVRGERTPARLTLPRAAELAVRIEHEGYRSYDEVVRPVAGVATAAVTAKLVPLPAALRVRSSVPAATWRLDDQPVGTGAAFGVDRVAPGTHHVRADARGFQARDEEVRFAPGQVVTLEWTLTPAPAEHKRARPSQALPDAPATDFRAP